MTSLSVVSRDSKVAVEVLEYFVSGETHYASVVALKGKPFVGGNKWAVWTCWATVKVSDLIIEPDDCSCEVFGSACPACVAANKARYGDEFPFSEATK